MVKNWDLSHGDTYRLEKVEVGGQRFAVSPEYVVELKDLDVAQLPPTPAESVDCGELSDAASVSVPSSGWTEAVAVKAEVDISLGSSGTEVICFIGVEYIDGRHQGPGLGACIRITLHATYGICTNAERIPPRWSDPATLSKKVREGGDGEGVTRGYPKTK